jgi:DNA-directed RNA polymerase subunit M/transcription elongation factor TFIIS
MEEPEQLEDEVEDEDENIDADDDIEEEDHDIEEEEDDEISIPIIQEEEEEQSVEEPLEEPIEEVPIDECQEQEDEIVVGHENNPTASRLMKRKENKYKFSKQLASYISQYNEKEKIINGSEHDGKYSTKDFQELRILVKKIYGKEMDSIIYKIVLNKVHGKAKVSFLIKTYLEILEDEERKKDGEVLQIRFEKEMNEFTEVRDVEEGHHTCKICGGKRTISNFVQVKSSDEPMSQYITCVNCANRWRLD